MFRNMGFALGILFCLGACLPNNYGPDVTSKKINKTTGYSNAQVREIFIDQPFLASGDYFLKANPSAQAPDHVNPAPQQKNQSAVSPYNQNVQGPQQNTQYTRGNYLPESMQNSKSVPGQQNQKEFSSSIDKNIPEISELMSLKMKVGILPDDDLAGSSVMDEFWNQADLFFRTRPEVLLIPRMQIYHSFGENKSTLNSFVMEKNKIPNNFSGLRNLLYIKTLKIPAHYPGSAYFRMKIFDFGLKDGFTMPVFKATVRNRADLKQFWAIILTRAWNQVLRNDLILPWFTRVVYQNKNVIYIDAGRNSGLKIGQILKVMEPGKIIKSQAGVAIGWLPGRLKGKLKVKGFTGIDKSIVNPSSTFTINKEDFIIVQQD